MDAEADDAARVGVTEATDAPPDAQHLWTNPIYGSFDHFGSSMLLLYVMSTGDGWDEIMFRGMDAVGPGSAPRRDDDAWTALYFVLWMFVGSFFALNLFVGVMVDNFSRIKAEEDGSATMTTEQQQWVQTMQDLMSHKAVVKVQAVGSPLGALIFPLVTSAPFERMINGVLFANTLIMVANYWEVEQDALPFTSLNAGGALVLGLHAASAIFYAEAALKVLAFGPDVYARDTWCRFELLLLIPPTLELVDALVWPDEPQFVVGYTRALNVLRVLRLLKDDKDVRQVLYTMVLSFPSLINVGSLLMLFIYSEPIRVIAMGLPCDCRVWLPTESAAHTCAARTQQSHLWSVAIAGALRWLPSAHTRALQLARITVGAGFTPPTLALPPGVGNAHGSRARPLLASVRRARHAALLVCPQAAVPHRRSQL
eukprot:6152377-Prymnesium_polylepis.1